jgi:hypothetical protein
MTQNTISGSFSFYVPSWPPKSYYDLYSKACENMKLGISKSYAVPMTGSCVPPDYTGEIEYHTNFNLNNHIYTVYKKDGKNHREDGPACIDMRTKEESYFLEGQQVTKKQHEFYCDLLKLKRLG